MPLTPYFGLLVALPQAGQVRVSTGILAPHTAQLKVDAIAFLLWYYAYQTFCCRYPFRIKKREARGLPFQIQMCVLRRRLMTPERQDLTAVCVGVCRGVLFGVGFRGWLPVVTGLNRLQYSFSFVLRDCFHLIMVLS